MILPSLLLAYFILSFFIWEHVKSTEGTNTEAWTLAVLWPAICGFMPFYFLLIFLGLIDLDEM